MKVTEKGQVTIPQAIRERFALLPGSEVEFIEIDGHIEVRLKDEGGRGRGFVERLRGTAGPGMSTDEIMALTRADD